MAALCLIVGLGLENIVKAEIDENGKLSVVPETAIESFALKAWRADYMQQGLDEKDRKEGAHFAVLEVCRFERA